MLWYDIINGNWRRKCKVQHPWCSSTYISPFPQVYPCRRGARKGKKERKRHDRESNSTTVETDSPAVREGRKEGAVRQGNEGQGKKMKKWKITVKCNVTIRHRTVMKKWRREKKFPYGTASSILCHNISSIPSIINRSSRWKSIYPSHAAKWEEKRKKERSRRRIRVNPSRSLHFPSDAKPSQPPQYRYKTGNFLSFFSFPSFLPSCGDSPIRVAHPLFIITIAKSK